VPDPVRAVDVEPEIVDWLWMNRIPKGMISLVAGKPDQGKGLFAAMLAATVSNDESVREGGGRVLYSAAEDSAGLMTRPRLEAAGANLDNVLLWRFTLPTNGRELGQIVVNEGIDLVVMDPLASHLTGGISRHSDNVRQVLTPLTELIESTGTAVLGRDPDDADRRVLAPAKFNIGPQPKALAFDIDTEDLETVGDVPYLEVDEEMMAFDPMRLFEGKAQPNEKKTGRPPDKRAAAAEWLTTYLADAGGPVLASQIHEDAKQYGMAQKTLRRAGDDMGVVKNPPGGGRNVTWDLPDEVKELMGIATTPEEVATDRVQVAEEIEDFDAGIKALLDGAQGGDE
jgi:hypothetical protein